MFYFFCFLFLQFVLQREAGLLCFIAGVNLPREACLTWPISWNSSHLFVSHSRGKTTVSTLPHPLCLACPSTRSRCLCGMISGEATRVSRQIFETFSSPSRYFEEKKIIAPSWSVSGYLVVSW